MEFVDYKRSDGEIEFMEESGLAELLEGSPSAQATVIVRPIGQMEEEALRRLVAAEAVSPFWDIGPDNHISIPVGGYNMTDLPRSFQDDALAQEVLHEFQQGLDAVPLHVSSQLARSLIRNELPDIVADPQTLAEVTEVLGRPARAARVTAIASIQARGWLFASAVAHHLGLALVPILKGRRMDDRGDFEEERYVHRSEPDPEPLSVLRHLVQGKRVLLVDDWLESGEQALAARRLIEKTGGEWRGVSVLCDGLKDEAVRALLKPIAAACRRRRNQWCVL